MRFSIQGFETILSPGKKSKYCLAIKYMSGEERGGILLNVQSEEEEQGREGRKELRELQESGVKVVTIIRPSGEYHDSEQIHITDDQHSPYSSFNK